MARKKTTNIVLVSGKARHGKDTTAEFIRKRLSAEGMPALIYHYADLLKFVCKSYLGWDGVKDVEGRALLQYVGTDVVRARDPNFWVDFAVRFLTCMDGHWGTVIIPDTRFPNEIDAFVKAKFPVYHLRVVRPNFNNGLTGAQKLHLSETALDGVDPDRVIWNHGTLEALQENVNLWTEEFLLCRKKKKKRVTPITQTTTSST